MCPWMFKVDKYSINNNNNNNNINNCLIKVLSGKGDQVDCHINCLKKGVECPGMNTSPFSPLMPFKSTLIKLI